MLAHSHTATLFRPWILAGLVFALHGCGSGSGDAPASVTPGPANVALAGVIDIETGTRVDADDAGTLALNAFPLRGAQHLPPEFILAGYVSAHSGTYSGLNTSYTADPTDTFSLSLRKGRSVYLQPFATSEGFSPLTFTLLSDSRILDAVSASTEGDPVQIVLPDSEPAGTYTLQVESDGAAPMLYILSSSAARSAPTAVFEWPNHEFVDAQAIVVFKRDKGGEFTHSTAARMAMEPRKALAPGVWLVSAPFQAARSRQAQPKKTTLEWIRTLSKRSDIASATPNYSVRAMQTPLNEPLYNNHSTVGQQWHYELIKAPLAWQLAPDGGAGVTVAVMDTGLYGMPGNWHGELNQNTVPGTDFVSEAFDNDDNRGRDSNPSDPGNAVGSSVFHGTHVAGTIVAAVNGAGGAGIAFNASLLPVRVLGQGGVGSSADLLEALNWVANGPGGTPRADIVNLSIGGLPFQPQLQEAINDGARQGIVFVAAAGNSASTRASYPAAFDNVFAVSAVDGGGILASYSNSGSWIGLAAPGGDVSRDGNVDGRSDLISSTSAVLVGSTMQEAYIGLQGTSMAAPHVSAVFALMKHLDPSLNYQSLQNLLMAGELTSSNCDSAPCPKTDDLGWGLLDAGQSVLAASTTMVPDLLAASPAIVNLSSEGRPAASVRLSVSGSEPDNVMINSVAAAAPWLLIESAPAAGESGRYFDIVVRLLPKELEAGVSARAPIVVEYTSDEARRLEIPVIGQRVTDQQARDAGRHFVLLVDPVPNGDVHATVAQTTAVAENGQYQFSFLADDGAEPKQQNEVPAGKYILVAGSDIDNDGLICHAGEACAEYPLAGLREEVVIAPGQPVTGIRMTTSYSRPAISAATPSMLPRPGFKGYKLMESPSAPVVAPKSIGVER